VLLLAEWADITDKRTGESPLDVAPLLESIASLEAAGDVLVSLHAEPAYRRHLRRAPIAKWCVIGYSTRTNKAHRGIALGLAGSAGAVVGRGAATGINLLIFHGAAASGAAAGGRTEPWSNRCRAAPCEASLRLTEQGEVVNSESYKPAAHCEWGRTLGAHIRIRGAGHGAGSTDAAGSPRSKSRPCAASRHTASRRIATVFRQPGVFEYFRAATPLDVIERMHIASRPGTSRRRGVQALRAVPWVFA